MRIPLDAIREAAARTAPHLHRTPMLSSRSLGDWAGVRLDLKCEASRRPARSSRAGLTSCCRSTRRGARAAWSPCRPGTNAQAVAWAARVVGVPATVVMPADAPRSKTDAVRSYGATIVAHADRATLFDRLREEEARTGATFVHPFDDPVRARRGGKRSASRSSSRCRRRVRDRADRRRRADAASPAR